MKMTEREMELAKRAAQRIKERMEEEALCPFCQGNAYVASGIAIDSPESCGEGHSAFAQCPECLGTGRS
jgi:ribosomal protein L37AE/L43A